VGSIAGGAGAVYLGLLHSTTDVAIKIVSSPTPAQQKNFIKEILILKACRHPNIVSFLGVSIQTDRTLLVMEAMPGGDLSSQIMNDEEGRYRWRNRWANDSYWLL
jgi:serine/threonine protein kinase